MDTMLGLSADSGRPACCFFAVSIAVDSSFSFTIGGAIFDPEWERLEDTAGTKASSARACTSFVPKTMSLEVRGTAVSASNLNPFFSFLSIANSPIGGKRADDLSIAIIRCTVEVESRAAKALSADEIGFGFSALLAFFATVAVGLPLRIGVTSGIVLLICIGDILLAPTTERTLTSTSGFGRRCMSRASASVRCA